MNELTFWLYIADIASKISEAGILILAIITIGFSFYFIYCAVESEFGRGDSEWYEHEVVAFNKVKSYVPRFLVIFSISTVVLCLIPNKKTMHLMLASEAKEALCESVDGQEVKEALLKVLNKYSEE